MTSRPGAPQDVGPGRADDGGAPAEHFGLSALAACGRARETATSATVKATTIEILLVWCMRAFRLPRNPSASLERLHVPWPPDQERIPIDTTTPA